MSTAGSAAATSTAATLALDAPAKINLFLHVTGRRDDGYHELSSLIAFAEAGDRLTVAPAETLELDVTGRFAVDLGGDWEGNLVIAAARALQKAGGLVGHGARIVLEKNLPVASGIGGGSADAAAALRLLMRLWGLEIGPGALAALGARLGADVPVCLAARPALVSGIGEVLDFRPPLPSCGLVLANAGAAVSTPAVFRARAGAFSPPADPGEISGEFADAAGLARALSAYGNDLADPAARIAPVTVVVREAIAATDGVLLARLSGSGGTCFGLYPDIAAAEAAAARLAADRPGWWVVATRFRDAPPEIREIA